MLTAGQSFFLMNLAFNAVMWGLFTRALTLASSTVRVSVINTSANFMLTALLGLIIFKETLPGEPTSALRQPYRACYLLMHSGLWWLGASFLVAGSVIIGRREERKEVGAADTAGNEPAVAAQQESFHDDPDAPLADAANSSARGAREAYDDDIELKQSVMKKMDGRDEGRED